MTCRVKSIKYSLSSFLDIESIVEFLKLIELISIMDWDGKYYEDLKEGFLHKPAGHSSSQQSTVVQTSDQPFSNISADVKSVSMGRYSESAKHQFKEPPTVVELSISEQLRALGVQRCNDAAVPRVSTYSQTGTSQQASKRYLLVQDDAMFRNPSKKPDNKKK